jgi:isocitrate/isopropylmalate dehydrogenase
MFEHFGRTRRDRAMRRAARLIERATEKVIAAGTDLTPDLGGKASTTRMGRAIAAAIGS